MAACSQRSFLPGLILLCVCVACTCASLIYDSYEKYDTEPFQLSRFSDGTQLHISSLQDSSNRNRRQTSNSNNLSSGKIKSSDAKIAQKLDKNSASVPSESAAGSVKKNGTQSLDETKDEFDDDVIAEFTNDTLGELPKIVHDHHSYYNSTVVTEPNRIDEFWVDLEKMINGKVITHEMLSKSYRRAATVTLTFDFPFYGHTLRNATIATGGFLYLGDYMHSWLASTQYIAPLMANFDTSLSDKSIIKYADNGTDFVVQWIETVLQDFKSAGSFTFQVRLRNTGDIVFAYKDIPVTVTSIPDSEHPVRVGVSDAYIIDRAFLFQKKKIIYEYHRVEIKKEHIANLTAVYLTALPSCISLKDCESCLESNIGFECTWCEKAARCSDGMDRHRHDWLLRGCESITQVPEDMTCPLPSVVTPVDSSKLTDQGSSGGGHYSTLVMESSSTPSVLPYSSSTTQPFTTNVIPPNIPVPSVSEKTGALPNEELITDSPELTTARHAQYTDDNKNAFWRASEMKEKSSIGAAGIVGILFVVALVICFVGWVIYAYKFPHTSSGQVIIKYRPSQWQWFKGEADYTPASVHI